MAFLALHQSVRANQWEAILVVANRIQRDLPSFYGVATLAVGSELAAMNIRMAIGAAGAYVLEDQTRMALHASDLLVHAAKRITGLVVVELRIRSDRLPACIGVAVLAGNGNRTVRICDLSLRLTRRRAQLIHRLLCRGPRKAWQHKKSKCQEPARAAHRSLQRRDSANLLEERSSRHRMRTSTRAGLGPANDRSGAYCSARSHVSLELASCELRILRQ